MSAATPHRTMPSFARMLAAVAAASPRTKTPSAANMAKIPVRKVISQKKPAARAVVRGEASAMGSFHTAVLMIHISLADHRDDCFCWSGNHRFNLSDSLANGHAIQPDEHCSHQQNRRHIEQVRVAQPAGEEPR